MKFERWGPALLVIALIGGTACGQEVTPFEEASVAVDWSVMPMGCEAAKVESVEVIVDNARNTYGASGDCEAGTVVIDDVVPGQYDISLDGVDSTGQVAFAAQIEAYSVRPGVDTVTGVVELEAVPATARISWDFGPEKDCQTAGAGNVEVIAYDAGYHVADRAVSRCDEEAVTLHKLRAGDYLIYGRAKGGNGLYEGVADVELGRGETGQVTVELRKVGVE